MNGRCVPRAESTGPATFNTVNLWGRGLRGERGGMPVHTLPVILLKGISHVCSLSGEHSRAGWLSGEMLITVST